MKDNYMLAEKIKDKIIQKLQEQRRNVLSIEKMAGLPQGAIRNIITGSSQNPKIETLYAIAKCLDCSLDELVGEIPKKAKYTRKLEWSKILFLQILDFISSYIEKEKLTLTLDQILFFVEEAYAFSLTRKDKKPDKEFIEWLIEHNINQQS